MQNRLGFLNIGAILISNYFSVNALQMYTNGIVDSTTPKYERVKILQTEIITVQMPTRRVAVRDPSSVKLISIKYVCLYATDPPHVNGNGINYNIHRENFHRN